MSTFHFVGGSASRSVFLSSTFVSRHLLRSALLAAIGFGAMAPAKAAVFWLDDDPMRPRAIMSEEPQAKPRQPKKTRYPAVMRETQTKEHAKPVGPLVISISIEKQTMRVFDANGLFAETRVSTGMRGHATPMGVFSIIQKNKYHRSNIYSGAPMPYMQRITWSGIALHAGALPGYPASHGCIRMPMAFATKLWGWTRMGARVVITPGEIAPTEISHPLLMAQKPAPVSASAPKLEQPAAAKPADGKSTDGKSTEAKPADLGLKPATDTDRTKTADASNAMGAAAKPVMSDAMAQADRPVAKNAATDGKAAGEDARVTRHDVDDAATKSAEVPVADTTAPQPDAKKDEARPADAPSEPMVKPEPKSESRPATAKIDPIDLPPPADTAPKRTGQVAVLISGKDGKLYVRQNFSPLFETDITIKAGDRPLGTHVFTARIDSKDEAKPIHWTAVSLPAVPRHADEDSASRRRKPAAAADVAPRLPDSAAEALDRVTIPEDAMAQIAEALATGGSIIVSDQSIRAGGETGRGTEFVVPLR